MAAPSLDASFQAASQFVAKNGASGNYSQDTQLDLYSLFKQATAGDLPQDEPEPSRFQFEKRAKWQARFKLRGVSKDEAKRMYVATLAKADGRFVNPAPAPPPKPADVPAPLATSPQLGPGARSPVKLAPLANGPASSTTTTNSSSSSPPPVASEDDAMFRFAVLGCLAMIGMGLGGFLLATLSFSALACLGLAGLGLMGLLGSVFAYFEEYGMLPYLSKHMVEMLLDTTLLEFILDDTLLKELNHFVVQLLPAMLAEDEDTKLEALSHMSLSLRRKLTMRGLVRVLPTRLTRVLLPRRLREQIEREEPKFRLQKNATDPSKLAKLLKPDADGVSSPGATAALQRAPSMDDASLAEDEAHDLTPSRRLARELFAVLVSKKNVELTLAWIDPHRAKMASGTLAIFALMQLTVSSRSREILKSFLQTMALLGSIMGSGFSAGLLFLWFVAKTRKREKGW